MSGRSPTKSTLSNIGVAMFAVADQDAALAFYTAKLSFEVRSDMRFGEHDEMRWLEVAPPRSRARLALNPPMGGEPGAADADGLGDRGDRVLTDLDHRLGHLELLAGHHRAAPTDAAGRAGCGEAGVGRGRDRAQAA